MRNIPLSLVYFIVVLTTLIYLPFKYDFINCDCEESLTLSIDSLSAHKTITPLHLTNVYKVDIIDDEITIYNNVENVSEQIKTNKFSTVMYILAWVIFAFILLAVLVYQGDYIIYNTKLKYLPTRSKMYYYKLQNDKIEVYRMGYFLLILENEYYVGDSLIVKLKYISDTLDNKNYSYEKEELKNWKK